MINELAGIVQNLRAADEKMFQMAPNASHHDRSTLQLAVAIWKALDLAERVYSFYGPPKLCVKGDEQ